MFEDVNKSIKVALFTLTTLHLPNYSSQAWDRSLLLALLAELKLPETYYDSYCPITTKTSAANEDLSKSKVITDAIKSAGFDLVDLLIGLSVFIRIRSFFNHPIIPTINYEMAERSMSNSLSIKIYRFVHNPTLPSFILFFDKLFATNNLDYIVTDLVTRQLIYWTISGN